MKAFLTTMKGKIIAGATTVAIVGAIIVAILIITRGYRTIAVENLNGRTTIVNNQTSMDAYVGQHLKSGDDVTVDANSDLTLALDSDKYVFAKENTHFWVEALGKKSDTRTSIHLDKGSTLCRIDNKLAASESFDVDTPNATMSVRGTVYRVSVYSEANGDKYTVIDVLEGEVYVQVKMENGQNTDESRLLKVGESAIVRSNTDFSEFVKSDDEENEIYYKLYGQNEAKFLGKAIDEGRVLCISKELLYDYVEINAHQFEVKEDDDSVYVCIVCGEEIRSDAVKEYEDSVKVEQDKTEDDSTVEEKDATADEKEEADVAADKKEDTDATTKEQNCDNGHSYQTTQKVEATCIAAGSETLVCSKCKDTKVETIAALGHKYSQSSLEPTCTETGYNTQRCDRCGDTKTETLAALGHNYSSSSTTAATCTSNGTETTTCSRCGDSYSSTIAATGHSYSLSSTSQATCTVQGTETYSCSNCGDSYTNSTGLAPHVYVSKSDDYTMPDGTVIPGNPYLACKVCGASQ